MRADVTIYARSGDVPVTTVYDHFTVVSLAGRDMCSAELHVRHDNPQYLRALIQELQNAADSVDMTRELAS